MKKFIETALALCCLALPLAGCKEAVGTVTSTTMSELEDIPSQILATPESADTEPEYNYIHFRYDNIWTVSALVSYEIVDNGQNIKFEINDSRYRDKVFYTSMSNVELVYRDNNVDYGTDYAVYPGNTSKFDRKGK
ncbi:hypothetical protein L3K78_01215 [Oscillospiraceae bacterium SCCA1]|nr:hypothetical protein [Oscillospiraceae bacterium SCCA1]